MFARNLHNKSQVGLYLTNEGIAIAEVTTSDNGSPELKACDFFSSTESTDLLTRLQQYIKDNGLKKKSCVAVLEETKYSLIQLPAPPVEDDELKSAVSWSLKDLLNYPVEDAVIDVFRVPVQQHREEKIYVVAAPKEDIQQTVNLIRKAGLKLLAIDIEELTLGDTIDRMGKYERGVAILHLNQQHGSISLFSDSALYLSRKIDFGLKQLHDMPEQDDTEQSKEQIYESILLELQRSLDYYESEFAKPQITKLIVAPKHPALQGFCDFVGSRSGLSVEMINLAQVYTESDAMNDENQANCFLAIAAASKEIKAAT